MKHQGRVLHEVALSLAEKEFEKFRIVQDRMLESDFDKELRKIQKKIKNNLKGWLWIIMMMMNC